MATIDLNSDVGESFGRWTLGDDGAMLSIVTSANIACGFHAGDPSTLSETTRTAVAHGVSIGAQVSYRDLAGFGRRFVDASRRELTDDIVYQIGALQGIAAAAGGWVTYVKPHGALYHDMLSQPETFKALLQVAKDCALKLMVPAGATTDPMREQAAHVGVDLLFEAFADRRYTRHKTLLARSQPGAVLSQSEMLNQARRLMTEGRIISDCGTAINLQAQTLCVHGDSPSALAALTELRDLVDHCVN